MLPALLEIDPNVVVPWSAIEAVVGVVFGLLGTVAAYAYKNDVKAVRIVAQSALEENAKLRADSLKAFADLQRQNGELVKDIAHERTERIVLEGKLNEMRAETRVREDIRNQNIVLDQQSMMLEAIARRTGSVREMPAQQPFSASRLIPREEPTSNPPPELPPSRARLPSRNR